MVVTPVEHVLSALRDRVDVPVVTKLPRPVPDVLMRLDVLGVRSPTLVSDETDLAVQCYGVSEDEVIDLAWRVRRVLSDEIYVLNPAIVWWQELSPPYEFPDPAADDLYRWQLTGTVTTSSLT